LILFVWQALSYLFSVRVADYLKISHGNGVHGELGVDEAGVAEEPVEEGLGEGAAARSPQVEEAGQGLVVSHQEVAEVFIILALEYVKELKALVPLRVYCFNNLTTIWGPGAFPDSLLIEPVYHFHGF
jgi:hypothetical protein